MQAVGQITEGTATFNRTSMELKHGYQIVPGKFERIDF